MRELSAQEFALCVFMSVCERKSRSRLNERKQSLIIDDCIELLRDGPLCSSVIRYKPDGPNVEDLRRRKVCAETLTYLEEIAPVVRAMAKRG